MRCFIAIPLTPLIRNELTAKITELKKLDWSQDIIWFPPENFHITLQFLGARLSEDKVEQATERLKSTIHHKFAPLALRLQKIEPFPCAEKPHTIVATVLCSNALQDITEEINNTMHSIGLTKSQLEFRPHISLGRVPKKKDIEKIEVPSSTGNLSNLVLHAEKICLYQSLLTNSSPIYTILCNLNLATEKTNESQPGH